MSVNYNDNSKTISRYISIKEILEEINIPLRDKGIESYFDSSKNIKDSMIALRRSYILQDIQHAWELGYSNFIFRDLNLPSGIGYEMILFGSKHDSNS